MSPKKGLFWEKEKMIDTYFWGRRRAALRPYSYRGHRSLNTHTARHRSDSPTGSLVARSHLRLRTADPVRRWSGWAKDPWTVDAWKWQCQYYFQTLVLGINDWSQGVMSFLHWQTCHAHYTLGTTDILHSVSWDLFATQRVLHLLCTKRGIT